MTVTTAPKSLDEIAKKYGIEPAKLRDRMQSFVKLKSREGLCVDLDIGKWEGKGRLEGEDIGITPTKEENDGISWGHQKLFPKAILNKVARLEGRGRANLGKNSFLSEEGRFVPVTAWQDFKDANEELRREFFEARDEMVKNYDTYLDEVRADFEARANKAYERLEKKPSSRTGFVTEYVKRLMAKIPAREEIHRRFYWEEKFFHMKMPGEVEEDLLRQERARKERELLYHQDADQRAKIEAMNDDLVAQLQAEKKKAQDQEIAFVWQTMKAQREAITKSLEQALTTIARNDGKFSGSTSTMLQNMVERAKKLNFFEDPEVTRSIEKIEHWLDKKPAHRSIPLFKRQSAEITAMMEDSIRKLDDEATRQEEVCRIVGSDLMASVRTVE